MKYGILLTFIVFSILAFSFAQSDTNGAKTVQIKKGKHFVNLKNRRMKIRNKPTSVSWNYVFQENCNYDLGDVDQKDWNKLTGLYFNLFNTRAETVMVGWRYNIPNDEIELAAYYHVNSGRDFTKPLLKVKRGEEVSVSIEVDYKNKAYTVRLKSKNGQAQNRKKFFHNRTRCGQINFYFGGNRTAPQDISILMKEVEVRY